MTRSLTCAMLFLAAAPLAHARDIGGELAYRERIALDPSAMMLVELRGPGGVVAEARVPTDGAQVPLRFSLQAPDNGAYRLQGAILLGGRQVWLSPVLVVPAGDTAADLGMIALTSQAATGFSARMNCGGTIADLGFGEQSARLRVGPAVFDLTATPAASGARYSDGAAPETVFWSKGNSGMLTLQGTELPECVPMIAPTLLPMTARGNEPFWSLDLSDGSYVLTTNMGAEKVEGGLPAPAALPDGLRFDVSEALSFSVERKLCRDSMSGMSFPLTVTVADKGQTLSGCGGASADLLDGAWKIVEVAGAPVAEGIEVTMTLDAAQSMVYGRGGCNAYNAGFTLTGEGLSFSPAASTMMACPEAESAQEQAFHQALAGVDGFDIGPDGTLDLRAAGTVVIRAGR